MEKNQIYGYCGYVKNNEFQEKGIIDVCGECSCYTNTIITHQTGGLCKKCYYNNILENGKKT